MSVWVSDKTPVRTVAFYTREPGLTPGSGPDLIRTLIGISDGLNN